MRGRVCVGVQSLKGLERRGSTLWQCVLEGFQFVGDAVCRKEFHPWRVRSVKGACCNVLGL